MAAPVGAIVAAEYAAAQPGSVRGLVLVDPAPPDGLPFGMFAESYAYPLRFGSKALMRLALREVGLPSTGALAIDMVQDAVSTDPHQYIAFAEAVARWNVLDSLPNLAVPVLLVWGERDKLMPKRIGKRYLNALPNAKMVVIPLAGHSPRLFISRPGSASPMPCATRQMDCKLEQIELKSPRYHHRG